MKRHVNKYLNYDFVNTVSEIKSHININGDREPERLSNLIETYRFFRKHHLGYDQSENFKLLLKTYDHLLVDITSKLNSVPIK